MTFWGKPEWKNNYTKHEAVACTWLSSEHDCDLRPQSRTHQKYKHMQSIRIVNQAMAQWSSPAGMSHTAHDVLYTGSTSCAM